MDLELVLLITGELDWPRVEPMELEKVHVLETVQLMDWDMELAMVQLTVL